MLEIPTAGWVAIAAGAGVLVLLAVLHFGFRVFRRRRPRKHRQAEISNQNRVEVLESTPIDAERRLVLVRCDGIEHLIMVGGPADVVVENDVKKVRGPGPAPARTPLPELEKRATPAPRTPLAASAPAVTPAAKPSDTNRPAARQPSDARPSGDGRQATTTPRSSGAALLPPPARTTSRSGEHPSSTTRPDDQTPARTPAQRPAAERRDPAPRRVAQLQPPHTPRVSEPVRPQSGTLGGDRAARLGRSNTRTAEEPAAVLPAAQIPWSDPDSIENEIVRALKFDPQIRGGESPSARRDAPAQKPSMDSSTTLGDLADRLEEALAREVQSASQGRKVDIDLEDFGFDAEGESEKPTAQKDRSEKRERSEGPRGSLAPTPEPESRREPTSPAERREEAPVISLNSRRRENSDQLEDEMARLLGELTGDTKGR